MRTIPLRHGENEQKSLDLFRQVLNLAGNQSLSVDDIRRRCKVLDLIDPKLNPDISRAESLTLEDGHYETLKACVERFPYNLATPSLLRVIDDVLMAKPAPVPN